MPSYLNLTNPVTNRLEKWLQFDDNSYAPMSIVSSLTGGLLTQLTSSQITALQNPVFPANFPLPSAQITALQTVTVANPQSSVAISNFPSGFNISNLPATYQWPSGQEAIVSGIKTRLDGFTTGTGNVDSTTLRVSPVMIAPTVSRTSIAASATVVTLATARSDRRSLTIYNDSVNTLHVGVGANTSTTDFTLKLFQDEFWRVPIDFLQLQITGIWTATGGSARITEGIA